jgi:hypothetical protein
MHFWDDSQLEAVMNANHTTFEQLVANAEHFLSKRRYGAAAVYSQIAANYAWLNHPGLFASSKLEGILLRLGGKLARHEKGRRAGSLPLKSPAHVLHVLTKAYEVGGHTRLVSRWIIHDSARVHSVALTRQGVDSVPGFFRDAVAKAGGKIHCLDHKAGGLLSRARTLRELAAVTDLVVLHIHPHDVVPIIAFADKTNSPPVIFLNHADHLFWIGTSVSDIVAHLSDRSLQTSYERRGIPPERCVVLPIPLQPHSQTLSRFEAKRSLGIDPATTVLLSVASAYKFKTTSEPGFVTVMLPVLQRNENVVLLVVGPSDRDEWADARQKTQGRVRAFGIVENPTVFFQAADIYLDSFPFASLTSLLEAGSYGVPLIRAHPYPTDLSVLRSDDPALTRESSAGIDQKLYREKLCELIENPALRNRIGEDTERNIRGLHLPPGWNQLVNDLYLKAATHPRLTTLPRIEIERSLSEQDKALIWMQTTTGRSQGLETIKSEHFRLLPTHERLTTWTQLKKTDPTLTLISLISESVGIENDKRLLRLRGLLSGQKESSLKPLGSSSSNEKL